MKSFYFFLFFALSLIINAQNNCDDASGYLVNAYSHVKDAYDANNISHLKYYANRSRESFKLSKKNLVDCGCTKALALANKGMDLLTKVEPAETFEDGRYFVKYAKEIAKESIVELDKFTASNNKNEVPTSALELEQKKLKQQQLALKQREQEIAQKLAEQEIKSLELKKEKLVNDYKTMIATNIKIYNETLNVCNCNHSLLNYTGKDTDIKSKNLAEIKQHYVKDLKEVTTKYLHTLALCSAE